MENIYIVGDVHGCLETLKKLINTLPKNSKIISVGDLVDKGPKTCETLDYVMELDNFEMVLGNHEKKFLEHIQEYLNGIDVFDTIWYQRWGGKESIDSYNHLNDFEKKIKMEKHLKFLSNQKYFIYYNKPIGKINKKIFITHGFALPYFKRRFKINEELTKMQFCCNRLNSTYFDINDKDNLKELQNYNVLNIFGHIVNNQPLKSNILIDVDTGCVYGNKLTCYDLNNDNFISIDFSD